MLEEAGLLLKLDMYMVDCVLNDIAWRLSQGLDAVPVSVNLSLRDLSDVDVAHEIACKAAQAGVSADHLRIEFTEEAASKNPELLKTQIAALHEHGFEVWMDDFGSGYSSLNLLKEFNFDLIKLDMGFFRGTNLDKSEIIVDNVIRATKRLGTKTLAEGVETAQLAQTLVDMGCDMLQGFLYFKPRPIGMINKLVLAGSSVPVEPRDESSYWDAVGAVSLTDLASNNDGEGVSESPVSEFPAGILERRDGVWHVLRTNGPLHGLLGERLQFRAAMSASHADRVATGLDGGFEAAVRRCEVSRSWERIAGALTRDSGYQFYVKPVAACEDAEAYLVVSAPSLLGAGLGTYGDVPVGYAVLHVLYDEGRDKAVDAEYVYANKLYRMWGGLDDVDLTGKKILDVLDVIGIRWLPLFYRAARLGKSAHDLAYSAKAGHWISYNVTPSPVEDHCIFAFMIADAEHRERQEIKEASMHDGLTGLLNRRGIDVAVAARMKGRQDEPFVLVLLDVNDFKTINGLYGHDMGDEILRLLARTLLSVFPLTAVVGRNGADEALVALFGADAHVVEQLLDTLMRRKLFCEAHGQRHPISLSIGHAWCLGPSNLKTAYTHADAALHAVKATGESGYRGWGPELDTSPQSSLLGFTSRDVAEGMPLAMLAHRADGTILFANEGLARLLGYATLAEALEATQSSLRSFVHPDDWERVQRHVSSDHNTAVLPGEERDLSLRIVTRTAEARRVVNRARLVTSKRMGDVLYAYIVDAQTLA